MTHIQSDITLFRQGKKYFDKNQKFQVDKGYEGEPLQAAPDDTNLLFWPCSAHHLSELPEKE